MVTADEKDEDGSLWEAMSARVPRLYSVAASSGDVRCGEGDPVGAKDGDNVL